MLLSTAIALRAAAKELPSVTVAGIKCLIEHQKGTLRELKNDEGKTVYKKHMFAHYGYIANTRGRDGDGIDVFVGPIQNPQEVYVVHMKDMGPDKDEREDEDKVMLGFPSSDTAKAAFLAHYPITFFDGMTTLPIAAFKKRLADTQKPHTHNMLHAKADKCPRCGSESISSIMNTNQCNACGKAFDGGGPGSGPRPGNKQPEDALHKHGWTPVATRNDTEIYRHPAHFPHEIAVAKNGNWRHTSGDQTIATGFTHGKLDSHLNQMFKK